MPRRRKDLIFEESLFNNMDDYEMYKARFYDLACGCFNFENLDSNIHKPFIIRHLIKEGQLLAFEDPYLLNKEGKPTFFLYPFYAGGPLNEYNQSTVRDITFFNNGAHYVRTTEDSEILHVNVSGANLYRVIEYFARNMYLINRTIQINVNAQKTPVALTCSENERLTYTNLLKEYQGNAPVIFGNKDLDLNSLKSISLQAPYVSDKLYILMENYWNQFLTFFGIPNINMNKRERLITDEVQRSMGGVLIAKQNFENQIQDDIERINKMFDKNIVFKWGLREDNDIEESEDNTYNEGSDTKEGEEE